MEAMLHRAPVFTVNNFTTLLLGCLTEHVRGKSKNITQPISLCSSDSIKYTKNETKTKTDKNNPKHFIY